MSRRLIDACSPSGILVPRPALLLVAVALGCVTTAVTLPLPEREGWVGWLPPTISASELAAIWTPAVAAAAAAYATGQPRAHGMRAWTASAPRARAARLAPSVVGVALACLLGHLVALVVLSAVSAHFGMLSDLMVPVLLVSPPTVSAYLLVWVAVGTLLGRLLRLAVALPVALFLPYAWYSALAYYLGDSPVSPLAVGDNRVYDYVRPDDAMLLIRLLFWLVLATCLWCLLLERRRAARVTMWAAGLVAGVAILRGPVYVETAGANEPVCVGRAPVTCLDGAHSTAMGRYRAAVERVMADLPVALRPAVFAARPELADSGAGSPHVAGLLVVPPVAGFTSPARIVDQTMFEARVGDAMFIEPCRRLGADDDDSAIALGIWWRLAHDIPFDEPAFATDSGYFFAEEYEPNLQAAQDFAALTRAAREAWFDEHAVDVRTCQAPPLPGPP